MWVKLHDGWDEHPKILSVTEPAVMLWIKAITYCNRNRTHGFVPRGALHKLSANPEREALADELADVRVPGCRGGLFDRDGLNFRVHDYEVYQPSQDTDAARGQSPSALSRTRSEAGKKGAAHRWHGKPLAPDGNEPHATDGTLPMANDAEADGNRMAKDGTAGAPDGPARAEPGPVGRPSMAPDGTLPMAPVATFATPDPVPVSDPGHSPPPTGAREATPIDEKGLATAAVWLAAVRAFSALAPLHNDHAWAHEVEGTSAHRGTSAGDARAAILNFVDKNAGRAWPDRDELVRELGGFVGRAKQIGDDQRARQRANEERGRASAARSNGHGGRPAPQGAPRPNPRAASELELDLGDGLAPRKRATG